MFIFTFIIFAAEWVETTQYDFADGFYEVNLYASHRGDGAVEFSPRFDANNDGWIDLLTCNEAGNSKIFWGDSTGFSDFNNTYYERGYGGGTFADFKSRWIRGLRFNRTCVHILG